MPANPEVTVSTPQPVASADESTTLVTSYKQVAEALVKYHNLHEGIWGVFARFGLAASNVGPNENELSPAAIVPLVELGLQKFSKENNLSVDAAKVNPKPKPSEPARQRGRH
jgi:hypothetical protein